MARLSDVLTIVNGKSQRNVENPNGQYPIYGSGGVIGYADDYICDAETVVIGRKGSINNPIFVNEPFWNVDTAFGLVAKKDILFPKYLYYFCEQFDFERLNTTVTIPSLTKANLLEVEMPLPSLDEQRHIAAILDKVTNLIALRKQQLAKLDELVKARFVEMFGEPVANPMAWDVVKLASVTTKIGSGATPKGGKESYQTSGISLIRSMNVYDGFFEYRELAHIDDVQSAQLDNVIVNKDDVLINITGASVARSCVVPDNVLPARVNQHVSIIRCKPSALNYLFLNAQFLNSAYKKKLLSLGEAGGATRQAITKQQLENLEIILPPIKLQKEFFCYAKSIQKSMETIQKGLDILEILKKSLIQKNFG